MEKQNRIGDTGGLFTAVAIPVFDAGEERFVAG